MPKDRAVQPTRAEYSARTAYDRSLTKSLRTQSKGTGWKTISGWLYQQRGDWFISILPSVYRNARRTVVSITVKPMAIDPIFWDIVGLPENRSMPLSFRANAAWGCHPPYLAEIEVEEHDDTAVLATRVISAADEQLEIIMKTLSADTFLAHCQNSGVRWGSHLPCVVSTLITMDRREDALAQCLEAQTRGKGGGFVVVPEGNFVQMAIARLQSELAHSKG
ncbi:hypothetical protein [Bosea sp. (in: a-proteobacteria)]|uniref:hypothetical protein n=1 Tax=Bosea sp. (in: a-proteobacteria) TaxID=1871050 RepID=UPI002B497962|nr:hypothetical protein [Bosea sp. (in: a-proteobacteria)]WRH58576.1 MAG: hypothetical protein RSE11_01945 [Bosea sp. (in: a-proteobacteria)]